MKLNKLIQRLQALETKYGGDTDVRVGWMPFYPPYPPYSKIVWPLKSKDIRVDTPKTKPTLTINFKY
jgi:hypothetical protein